ncbi:hypothetical protein HDU98_010586, partial [Podochytrium sp. JEL0797]
YHAGYNLGFNCAESVNFAVDSWIEKGKRAAFCSCVGDSVKLDVPHLFEGKPPAVAAVPAAAVRASAGMVDGVGGGRKMGVAAALKVAEKKGVVKQCVLCPDSHQRNLLPTEQGTWAHKRCAEFIPETEIANVVVGGVWTDREVVVGVDKVPKDRWALKCQFCKTHVSPTSKKYAPYKAVGASIQCYKGKCVRAYHVSCADTNGIYMTPDFMCFCPQHAKPILEAASVAGNAGVGGEQAGPGVVVEAGVGVPALAAVEQDIGGEAGVLRKVEEKEVDIDRSHWGADLEQGQEVGSPWIYWGDLVE